jgi:hypothetical protein
MTTKDEALHLARKALSNKRASNQSIYEALAAIDQALGGHKSTTSMSPTPPKVLQQEQGEPVAWDDSRADEIVTQMYRRFKDWSKRGFSADEVTWCEVKAEINQLITLHAETRSTQTVKQPPLAYLRYHPTGSVTGKPLHELSFNGEPDAFDGWEITSLYTKPQPSQKQEQDEPVAQWQKRHPTETENKWKNTNEADAKWWRDSSVGWEVRALYTKPQPSQKSWVGLTDDELVSLRGRVQEYTPMNSIKYGEAIQRATIQALQEKNK